MAGHSREAEDWDAVVVAGMSVNWTASGQVPEPQYPAVNVRFIFVEDPQVGPEHWTCESVPRLKDEQYYAGPTIQAAFTAWMDAQVVRGLKGRMI